MKKVIVPTEVTYKKITTTLGIPAEVSGIIHNGYSFGWYSKDVYWEVGVSVRAGDNITEAIREHEKKYPPKTTYHYRFFKEAK